MWLYFWLMRNFESGEHNLKCYHCLQVHLNLLQMNQSAASHLSDVLSHILYHHFISSDGLLSEQTPVMDV